MTKVAMIYERMVIRPYKDWKRLLISNKNQLILLSNTVKTIVTFKICRGVVLVSTGFIESMGKRGVWKTAWPSSRQGNLKLQMLFCSKKGYSSCSILSRVSKTTWHSRCVLDNAFIHHSVMSFKTRSQSDMAKYSIVYTCIGYESTVSLP